MTEYVDIRMTRKQAKAADNALMRLMERAEEHMSLEKPLGTITEERALFYLRAALIKATQ